MCGNWEGLQAERHGCMVMSATAFFELQVDNNPLASYDIAMNHVPSSLAIENVLLCL